MNNQILLSIKDLSIGFQEEDEIEIVVDGISFTLNEGEMLGIVGESGSGKTMISLAIMGLLSRKARILSGEIIYKGKNLLIEKPENLRRLKGKEMSMIFQEPKGSFNPVLKIGEQLNEMLKLHTKYDKAQYKEICIKALEGVGLSNPETVYNKYPHEISGGMAQRAMIAMAMIAEPKLLIADEPTTALDATTQYNILEILREIHEDQKNSIILISHDLSAINKVCHRTLVMKDGKLIEEGRTKEIFENPQNEYTKLLIDANFEVGKSPRFLNQNKEKGEKVLEIKNLNIYYQEKVKNKILSKKERTLYVENASFNIKQGETFGIVGESGSGKSTLAKGIVGIVKDVEGEIIMETKPQMVFQDPYSSLNPAKKVKWILEEPLKNSGGFTREDRRKKIKEVIYLVGLKENYLERYISELSGGQRQRIAIAVALILNPQLIILDEAVSSLDATVQGQILELLSNLQRKLNLSYLFISHDLNIVYQVCDQVGVMYKGEIVEMKSTKELFHSPEHFYTKKLLETLV